MDICEIGKYRLLSRTWIKNCAETIIVKLRFVRGTLYQTHIFIAFSLFIKIVFTLMITVRRPGVPFFSLLAGWYETVSVLMI